MEGPASKHPELPTSNSTETIHAYHCCQDNMCNNHAKLTRTVREAPMSDSPMVIQKYDESLNKVKSTNFSTVDNSSIMWLKPFHSQIDQKNVSNETSSVISINGNKSVNQTIQHEKLINDKNTTKISMVDNFLSLLYKPFSQIDQKNMANETFGVVTNQGNYVTIRKHDTHDTLVNDKKTSNFAVLDNSKTLKWFDFSNFKNSQRTDPVGFDALVIEHDENDDELNTKHKTLMNDKKTSDFAVLGNTKALKWIDFSYFRNGQKTVPVGFDAIVSEHDDNDDELNTKQRILKINKKRNDFAMLGNSKTLKWIDFSDFRNGQKSIPVGFDVMERRYVKDNAEINTKHETLMNDKKISDFVLLGNSKKLKWVDFINFKNGQKIAPVESDAIVTKHGNNNAKVITKRAAHGGWAFSDLAMNKDPQSTLNAPPEEFPLLSYNHPIYFLMNRDIPIKTITKTLKNGKKKLPDFLKLSNGDLYYGVLGGMYL